MSVNIRALQKAIAKDLASYDSKSAPGFGLRVLSREGVKLLVVDSFERFVERNGYYFTAGSEQVDAVMDSITNIFYDGIQQAVKEGKIS